MALTVCLSWLHVASANIDADYKDHRIYVTYNALYRMFWSLQDPSAYKRIAKDHPEAAPLLRAFLTEKIKPKMNISAAILLIDFGADQAFFKMTDDNDGYVSPQHGWEGKTRKIAELADTFLHAQAKANADAVFLASNTATVVQGWARLSQAGKDPYVSTLQAGEVAKAYISLTKSSKGVKELTTLTKSDPGQATKINAFVREFGDTDFARLHDVDIEANAVKHKFEAVFEPQLE